jgi:hypothetical protein
VSEQCPNTPTPRSPLGAKSLSGSFGGIPDDFFRRVIFSPPKKDRAHIRQGAGAQGPPLGRAPGQERRPPRGFWVLGPKPHTPCDKNSGPSEGRGPRATAVQVPGFVPRGPRTSGWELLRIQKASPKKAGGGVLFLPGQHRPPPITAGAPPAAQAASMIKADPLRQRGLCAWAHAPVLGSGIQFYPSAVVPSMRQRASQLARQF